MGSNELICFLLLVLTIQTYPVHGSDHNERKPYVVYLGNAPNSHRDARAAHHSLLTTLTGDEETARGLIIYSYLKSFNAFAAKLTLEEADRLSGIDGIVSVFPDKVYDLHTTRSWDYLGFPQKAWRSTTESNVVVGMLDTGIWPQSPSFNDKGMGPPPKRWKGKCITSGNFTCNNKVIGAQYFHIHGDIVPPEIASPIDVEGHGSHTSSTVAGATVEHASLYGLADGTARGAVPSARIAMYKVCWSGDGCKSIDILAGIDAAIHDGVDIISMSFGSGPNNYFADVIAIGAFHAMQKGILVSASAGNNGPMPMSVSNGAPWMLTVAASSIDRQYRTTVELGNGEMLEGVSVNTFSTSKKGYPLTSGAAAGIDVGSSNAAYCMDNTLDEAKVKGNTIACITGASDETVIRDLDGTGVLWLTQPGEVVDTGFVSFMPSTYLNSSTSETVSTYISSTKNPKAVIYKSHEIRVEKHFVPSFSSRGPSIVSNNLLKPDVSAPGLDILAAWTLLSSIVDDPNDSRRSNYNIVSGTSMACPHASGVGAYIKSFHPTWSPAAIKSAIMTTAKDMTSSNITDAEFLYGSGQINPGMAVTPGLVYDMNGTSYIWFLCNEGYDPTMISILTGNSDPNFCSQQHLDYGPDGLNYPSFQYMVKTATDRVSAVYRRTVKNVGPENSVYRAAVKAPKGLSILVVPERLVFDPLHKERTFTVVLRGEPLGSTQMLSGSLTWEDGRHVVRSPIVVSQPFQLDY